MIAPHGKIRKDALYWAYVISCHAVEDINPFVEGVSLRLLDGYSHLLWIISVIN